MFTIAFNTANALYFCAAAKEIFNKRLLSLDFFGSFFHQGKNEHSIYVSTLRSRK